MRIKNGVIHLACTLFLLSRADSGPGSEDVVTLPDIDISASENGIVPFPPSTSAVITGLFSR